MNLVSVVIPTHNRAKALVGSIRSVLDGSYPDVEVIVVDDASTDDTEAVMTEFVKSEPRVRYHRQTTNQHANVARNLGFEMARGDFICFLDSDDLFRPEKNARQVEALLAHPEAGACVCQIQLFREHPGDLDLAWNRLQGEHPLLRYAANDVVWGTAAPLWRRSALEKTGPWDPALKFHQDLDYHLRALVEGVNFVLIPDILEDYHDAATGTISSGTKSRPDNIARLMDIYERAEGIAQARGILDDTLKARFAATYLWCAFVAARTGELPAAARGREAGRRIDPDVKRASRVYRALGLFVPLLAKLRTGAKPLIDRMGLIGLPYHRWKYAYTLADVQGQAYDGPMEYLPS